jgi:hypothetical protein
MIRISSQRVAWPLARLARAYIRKSARLAFVTRQIAGGLVTGTTGAGLKEGAEETFQHNYEQQ